MTKYLCCFLIARLVAWQPTGKLMNSRRPHRSTTFTFGQVDRRSEEGLGGQIPAGVTCFVFFLFFLLGRKCSAARQCQCQKSDIGRLRHYRNILITQSPNLKRGEDTAENASVMEVSLSVSSDPSGSWLRSSMEQERWKYCHKAVATNWLDRCRLEVNLRRLRPTDRSIDRSIGISLTLIWLKIGKLTCRLTD